MSDLNFDSIQQALNRIAPYINHTPIFSSQKLNELLKNTILFKMENQQKANSFKARGAFNAVLAYREKFGFFPKKMVAYSSGNHGYALALVGKTFGIPTLIFMTTNCTASKLEAVKSQNAELVLLNTRLEAILACQQKEQEGYVFFHPSDNDQIIAGQGTCILEDALVTARNFEAIFASCGGGGLLSGCFLASQKVYTQTKVIGCEPNIANDASLSVQQNKIIGFQQSPNTVADGARTLQVSDRCFFYLKQLHKILEISEEKIIFWQQQLTLYLQQNIEYTSALAMAGCADFLAQNQHYQQQKFLIIISGGNV